MRLHLVLLSEIAFALNPASAIPVFINEFHYDNTGTDTGEFVEIAGPAGTNLSGFTLSFYNGTGGATYDSLALSGVIPNLQNGFGTLGFLRAEIQNDTDGLALSNAGGLIQFISYEGTFSATAGPALGNTSSDVGVQELSTTPVGFSLQLGGVGTQYENFTWQAPQLATSGLVNTNQRFAVAVPETGATIMMLGLALVGMVGVRSSLARR